MEEGGGVEGGALSGLEGECRVGSVEGVEGLGGWHGRLTGEGWLLDTRAGRFRWVLDALLLRWAFLEVG